MTEVIIEPGLLSKLILKEGTGEQPKEGDEVEVHYVGTLESDGSKFDSSRDRNETFKFTIGQGVIKGWSVGVATMKVGEISKFSIGSEWAYGSSGSPPKIPGGATLVFEIELIKINKKLTLEEALTYANKVNEEAGGYFRQNNLEKALFLYNDAVSVLSDKYDDSANLLNSKIESNISLIYSKLGKWQESLKHAENSISKDEKNIKALVRKCEALIMIGNFSEALKIQQKGMNISNNDPIFINLLNKIKEFEKKEQAGKDSLYAKMFRK